MPVSKTFLLAPLVAFAAGPAFACYTVYDSSNHVLYQSPDKPPVDMSLPLHEAMAQRFPGGQLVFDQSTECPVVSPVAMGDGGPVTRTSSPLLTDERTARRIGAPHRIIDGVAVIDSARVAMKPGVTVVPSATVASKSPPSTAVLGGPPAR